MQPGTPHLLYLNVLLLHYFLLSAFTLFLTIFVPFPFASGLFRSRVVFFLGFLLFLTICFWGAEWVNFLGSLLLPSFLLTQNLFTLFRCDVMFHQKLKCLRIKPMQILHQLGAILLLLYVFDYVLSGSIGLHRLFFLLLCIEFVQKLGQRVASVPRSNTFT